MAFKSHYSEIWLRYSTWVNVLTLFLITLYTLYDSGGQKVAHGLNLALQQKYLVPWWKLHFHSLHQKITYLQDFSWQAKIKLGFCGLCAHCQLLSPKIVYEVKEASLCNITLESGWTESFCSPDRVRPPLCSFLPHVRHILQSKIVCASQSLKMIDCIVLNQDLHYLDQVTGESRGCISVSDTYLIYFEVNIRYLIRLHMERLSVWKTQIGAGNTEFGHSYRLQ